ncbi:hypothetical protein [Microvirga sp. 2TAF3]|uniref:hypothetical protein n=1 Tax=Microvirga sp. 2TAF3 TaxID=3233014 RepID=UPI003F949F25
MQFKKVGMHDVLCGEEPLHELLRLEAQPRAACLAKGLGVADANVGSHGANHLFMLDLREMSKWRTG